MDTVGEFSNGPLVEPCEGRGARRGGWDSIPMVRDPLQMIAQAMAMFWRYVFDPPRYRDRRRPTERTPRENVPSMPARLLCRFFHSGMRCCFRLAMSG